MSTNYFKVVGIGLGRVSDCFPFSFGTQHLAFAKADALRERMSRGSSGVRVSVYKPIANHPECCIIGDSPPEKLGES